MHMSELPWNQFAGIMRSRTRFYEHIIELNDLHFAIGGLLSHRKELPSNTKVYVETTLLVVICFIRLYEIEKARPYIKEILTNETVIKPTKSSRLFRQKIVNRFNEEVILSVLKNNARQGAANAVESIKKVFYNSLCKPESEIYKAWFNNGLQLILSKGYIRMAVFTSMISLQTGVKLFAVHMIALGIKFGIEIFCEKCKRDQAK